MPYFHYFLTDPHVSGMESRDAPHGLGFYCANILVLLICKPSFFSDGRKSKGKNILKGKMKDQTAAALIILTGDVRLLK